MNIKKNIASYIVIIALIALVVLSVIFKWVGVVCLFFGLCCIFYTIGVKAQNAVLEDINDRLIKQVASINQHFGETQAKLEILTKALARYMVDADKNAGTDEEKEDSTETE